MPAAPGIKRTPRLLQACGEAELLVQVGGGAGGGMQGIVVGNHQALEGAGGNVSLVGIVVAGVRSLMASSMSTKPMMAFHSTVR